VNFHYFTAGARQGTKAILFATFLALLSSPTFAESTLKNCPSEFGKFAKSFRYPEEISELKPGIKHTIHDMEKFLRDKLGTQLAADLSNDSTRITIMRGPGRRLKEHFPAGSKFEEMKNPFGAFNVVKVTPKKGKPEFVLTNVNGESRYLQVLSLLKLGGVAESRVRLTGQLSSYEPLYKRTFENIGHKPDLVVFGFSNTALQGLVEKPGVKNAAQILRRNQRYADQKWEKPAFHQHELKKMGVQVIQFKNGKKVWFVDNEYGDRAVDLYEALEEHGAGKIILLGTAGALDDSYRVGDIVSPRYFLTDEGHKFNSPFRSRLKKDGLSIDVETPTIETKKWLKEQIDEGADFVDVELVKVAREALERDDDDFAAYLIVSDLLNTKKPTDYTQWTEAHRQKAKKDLTPIIDHHLREAGIENPQEISSYKIFHFDTEEAIK